MRGGFTINEMYNTSVRERKLISDIVEEHMETTKRSGLPYF